MSYSDSRVSLLLPNLAILLASPKKDEEISEELAEMLGFDAIELVMEVLGNRLPLSYKVQLNVPSYTDYFALVYDDIPFS